MAPMGDSGSVINCANRATDVSILDWRATPVPVPPESPSDKFMSSPFLCQAYTKSAWEARGRGRNRKEYEEQGRHRKPSVGTSADAARKSACATSTFGLFAKDTAYATRCGAKLATRWRRV